MSAWYLDSSAIVKLAVQEPETDALVAWRHDIGDGDVLVTCELAVAEVVRAVARVGGDIEAARAQVDALAQVVIDRDLLLAASALQPPTMRTLDAIHLAAASAIGDDLGGVVTYDERMASAARTLGLALVAPGR